MTDTNQPWPGKVREHGSLPRARRECRVLIVGRATTGNRAHA